MTPVDQQLREKWEKEAEQQPAKLGWDNDGTAESEDIKRAYLAACEARHREYQGDTKHIRVDVNKLPQKGSVHCFGYCQGCNDVGLRHCAHADSCGNAGNYVILRSEDRREYQERVATLEGLLREAIPKLERAKQSYLSKMDYVEAAEFHAVYLKCCAALSPPPAKQE